MDNDPAIGAIVLTGSEKVIYIKCTIIRIDNVNKEEKIWISSKLSYFRHLQLELISRRCSTGILPPTIARTSLSGGATSP